MTGNFPPAADLQGPSDRRAVWVRRLLDVTVRAPRLLAWELTVVGLLTCWMISYALGGAGSFPPHWFYFVILLAAIRFRWHGALITAVIAGVLAGPLLPASVDAGTSQPLSDWLTRAAFFVALGQAFAFFVSLSRQSLNEEIARLRIERDVLRGLDFGEFRILYQPIVRLDTERVVGVEALVRWKHAVYGALEPNDFIIPAESSNAIVALGDFVLEETCRQIARWKPTALSDVSAFHVAVNVSTRQLEDPAFKERIAAILKTTGMNPRWLHLEVTETALIADIDTVCARLRAIKRLGVRVDIDDFGTGYSSLAYLHRLPADVVKIDRSFVSGLNDPERANVILELITSVASRLEATTLAEGVESVEDAMRLREFGCELAQGFYFDGPLEAEAMYDRLIAERDEASHSQPRVPLSPSLLTRRDGLDTTVVLHGSRAHDQE